MIFNSFIRHKAFIDYAPFFNYRFSELTSINPPKICVNVDEEFLTMLNVDKKQ